MASAAAQMDPTPTRQAATASLRCLSNAHSHPYIWVRVKAMQRTQSSKATGHDLHHSADAPAKAVRVY